MKKYSFFLKGQPRWHPIVICFKPCLFRIIPNDLEGGH